MPFAFIVAGSETDRHIVPEFDNDCVYAGRRDGKCQQIVILVEGVAGNGVRPTANLRARLLIYGNGHVGIWKFIR